MWNRRSHQLFYLVRISLGLSVVIVVLALRTYVVWNGDKRVGIGLALLLGLHQIPNAILLYKFVEGIGCEYRIDTLFFSRSTFVPASAQPFLLVIENQYPEIYGGCAYNHATRLIFVDWIMLSVVEGGTLRSTNFRGLWLIWTGSTQLSLF